MTPNEIIALLAAMERRAAIIDLMRRAPHELADLCLTLGIRPLPQRLATAEAIMGAVAGRSK